MCGMTSDPWPMRSGQLVLRYATEADIERILAIRNDPATNEWTLVTSNEPDRFRAQWLGVRENDRDFSCVAELDRQVVAMGFVEIKDGLGQPGMPLATEAEIGYMVDPAFAGRGIATDVARGLLTACFDHLELRRVTAGLYSDNVASMRVLEKAGMRREQHGIEDGWHVTRGWIDGYTYALLAREWRTAQESPGGTSSVTSP